MLDKRMARRLRLCWPRGVLMASVLSLGGCATAPPTRVPILASPVTFEEVTTADGIRGKFCLAPDGSGATLVFIGGSEGGLSFAEPAAAKACRNGYSALALAYWRYPALPDALEEIPLEYFDRALAWLATRTFVDDRRVGLVGYSRGGEGALLVASRNPYVAAVVGIVPGSYVGASIDFADFFKLQSAWSVGGVPLPFATMRVNQPGADWRKVMSSRPVATPESERADFATVQRLPSFAAAVIPVERIMRPVLLIGADRDTVWASSAMSEYAANRMRGASKRPNVLLKRFRNAEHSFMLDALQGKPNAEAERAWKDLFLFFDRTLRRTS